jgi:hypothetical protein
VIALAASFFVLGYHRVQRGNAALETDYKLADNVDADAIKKIWEQYGRRRNRKSRKWEFAGAWAVGTMIALIAYLVLTPHPNLVRGVFSWHSVSLPMVLVVLALALVVALTVLCADELFLCVKFIRELSTAVTEQIAPGGKITGAPDSAAMDAAKTAVELIAKRTETIGALPVLPFLLLSLMLLSGSPVFEGWQWSWALSVTYVSICATLVIAAFLLQREAEGARSRVTGQLRIARSYNRLASDRRELRRAQDRIDAVLDHIGSIRGGAFVDWFRHPLLQAILLPSTAPALVLALQRFIT